MSSPFLASLAVGLLLFIMGTGFSHAQSENVIGGVGLGLKPTADGRVIIDRVAPNGPAAQAGIQPGDWLVRVDERAVDELGGTQLVDAIRGPIGSKLTLVYLRGDRPPVAVTLARAALGAAPSQTPPPLPREGPVTGAHTSPPPPGKGGPIRGAMKFSSQSVRDPAANNVLAATFLLPQGWQYQGQIVWMHEFSVLANLRLKLWETNTSTTLEWLPTQHFSYTDQLPGLIQPGGNWMGAILAPPVSDPAGFVEGFWAPQVTPQLRALRPVVREDFPIIAQQTVAQDPGWRAQAVRLRYVYERQAQSWEQDVYFTLAYAPVNSGVAMWNVQRAFTCTAPKGRLDASASVIKAVIANVSFTPEWLATYSVVQQLRRQGLQQQMADTAAFGRQLQQYHAQVQQLGQQMHEDRMKSFDRIAESQREYLGGVETYSDPFQHLGVYLPAGYQEHWVNQKGEVVLSEQIGYNPNVGDVNDWRKMERRDPMQK